MPDLTRVGWDPSARVAKSSWPRRRGFKDAFRLHAPLSDCSGSRRCRLLRRRGSSRGGRPSHFSCWDARHCHQPPHAIMRATAAAPYRVQALVVGRSPCVATPASRRLFAAKGFPRSLRCSSAASAFEIARKLSPRCPLNWARSCALLTTSGRASAWLLRLVAFALCAQLPIDEQRGLLVL